MKVHLNVTTACIAAPLCLIALPQSVFAETCENYIGQTPQISEIETAIERNQPLAPKGEFETATQYEARKATETKITGPLVISMKLEGSTINKNGLEYDADRQVFKLNRYAFAYGGLRVKDLWGFGSPLSNEDARNARMHISLLVKKEDKPTGTYEASNAFGRKTEVIKLDGIQWGIYDRPLQSDYRTSYTAADVVAAEPETGMIGEIPVPITEAKQFKESASVAVVVEPQAPWSIKYRKGYPSKPTIRRPLEETVVLNVLFADIQCALILDGNKRVAAAFDTR
ncbi:hypothetical protein [Parasphingorhabdus sp.]|uniref:hypothetical protein n=1 Tax=Parasphingorhabdus sp. TaxID=2709688 RepID=UPI003D29526B